MFQPVAVIDVEVPELACNERAGQRRTPRTTPQELVKKNGF
jgi:hypothetical protein